MTALSIIILNWNTADLLADCLTSVQAYAPPDTEVIVVDNASTDSSAEMVQTRFPQMTLITQTENVGFSQGNNVGLAAANGRYLLCLNPDTQLHPGAIEPLVAWMEENPKVGIAGPTLWNPDGSLQRSTVPLPTLWVEFLRQTMLYRLTPTRAQRQMFRNERQPVGVVTGAALCLRRSCYEQIGGFDPQIFMFYEDTDLCKRAWDAGWEVWFVPTPGITHVKAAASSRFVRTRTLIESQKSAIYYFQKHNGRSTIPLLRLMALPSMALRSALAIFNWVMGRNCSDQKARLHAYGRITTWAVKGRW
jgi:N-acetylglucosaminyl-diphospho-decaprenol L-rhamnosyltransferase